MGNADHENGKQEHGLPSIHKTVDFLPQPRSRQPGRIRRSIKVYNPVSSCCKWAVFAWMEIKRDLQLKRELQAIIERAGVLLDGLADKIKNNNNSVCRSCPEPAYGLYCHDAITAFPEKERLIAIRDSLKEVGDALMLLQKIQCWQPKDRDAAFTRLEESRLALMGKVAEYQGPPLDVVKELKACFNNGKTAFEWDLNVKRKHKANSIHVFQEKKRLANLLVCCVRMVLNPWKWHKAVGILAKLTIVSVSISSSVNFYCLRQQCWSSQRRQKFLRFVDPSYDASSEGVLSSSQSCTLDVFYGRG